MSQSNFKVEISLPDGSKRQVEPWEVPMVNEALANRVIQLQQINSDLLKALRNIATSTPESTVRGLQQMAKYAIDNTTGATP